MIKISKSIIKNKKNKQIKNNTKGQIQKHILDRKMELTTFLILVTIYVVAIAISMFIEDKTQKLYYFMIIGLGTLVYLNVYLSVVYYIKLRNEPGVPGPRGPKGDKGPTGSNGKCKISDKCGFSKEDADKILYEAMLKPLKLVNLALKTNIRKL